MKTKFLSAHFLLLILTNASCQNSGKLSVIADMPSSLKENSGLVSFDGNTVWTIEDGGNSDNIFKVDFKGRIIKHLDVKNAKNRDWEDLAKDDKGNLYIGDFGNNDNQRKNLEIYKLPNPEIEKGGKINVQKIKFHYPEQERFPPSKKNRLYDAEAFFHWGNSLYIITKNRTRPYNGKALIYKVPDTQGTYEASLLGELFTCNNRHYCSVTSAAISPDGKTITLLGYGMLWLITDFKLDNFHSGKVKQLDLGLRTQLEAICFKNKHTVLLSDERSQDRGGNLYTLNLTKVLESEAQSEREP